MIKLLPFQQITNELYNETTITTTYFFCLPIYRSTTQKINKQHKNFYEKEVYLTHSDLVKIIEGAEAVLNYRS